MSCRSCATLLKRTALALLATSVAWSPKLALAEGQTDAAELFNAAEVHMRSGDYATACQEYAQSYRLDAQLGALLHLADCEEKRGHAGSAWRHFSAARAWAEERGDPRAAYASSRAAALVGRFATLSLDIPERARIATLTITCDGEALPESAWSAPWSLDSGPHQIEASAPDHQTFRISISVGSLGRAVVQIPELAALVAQPSSTSLGAAALRNPELVAPRAPSSAHGNGASSRQGSERLSRAASVATSAPAGATPTLRLVGYSALGVGALLLAGGAAFEVTKGVALSERDQICPTSRDCTLDEKSRIDGLTADARAANRLGTAGLISGATLIGAGAVLVLSSAHRERSTALMVVPSAGQGCAFAELVGAF